MRSPSVPRPFLERHPEARYWLDLGLQPNSAKALVKAGYLTLADLAGKSREDLTSIRGFGKRSLALCEALLGSAIPSRTEDLAAHGILPMTKRALDRAGIRSLADLGKLMGKRASVIGTVLRARPLEEKIALSRRFAAEMLPLFDTGALRPVIDSRFPLDAVAEAHARMESNANAGKILLDVRP